MDGFAVIDTCSLDNLLKDASMSKRLPKKLLDLQIKLLIPLDAITEIFEGGDDERIANKITNFGFFKPLIDDNVVIITKPTEEWLRKELRRNGLVSNVPTAKNSPRWPYLLKTLTDKAECLSFLNKLKVHREGAKIRKENLLKVDKKLRSRALSFPNEDLAEAFNPHVPLPFGKMNFYYGAFARLPGFSKKRARKIVNSSGIRFNYLRTYIRLIYLRGVGNAIRDYSKNPELLCIKDLKKGNWDDLAFIVMGSLCSYLITDDNALKDFNNYLNQSGFVKSQAMSLSEFLTQSIGGK
ncbi:MAG: hypothetical protein K2Q26_12450 [Bdellovibrionales bacterium]|nr:hypothetical protein [Bdellovibrionales bacterium]